MAALDELPPWVGNAPAWALVAAVIVSWIKVWPKLKQQGIDERLAIKSGYVARIEKLERDIVTCREECDRETERLKDEIGDLQFHIAGIERNRIQEQISLINAIINSVDAPELKALVRTLEAVQAATRQSVIHSHDETVIQPKD